MTLIGHSQEEPIFRWLRKTSCQGKHKIFFLACSCWQTEYQEYDRSEGEVCIWMTTIAFSTGNPWRKRSFTCYSTAQFQLCWSIADSSHFPKLKTLLQGFFLGYLHPSLLANLDDKKWCDLQEFESNCSRLQKILNRRSRPPSAQMQSYCLSHFRSMDQCNFVTCWLFFLSFAVP